MLYFAESTSPDLVPVVLALVAILGTVITALFKLLSDNTRAQKASAKAQEHTAKQFGKLVQETKKGNIEAAERNGHLGEQNIQITELITKHTRDMKSEFAKLDVQTIQEQKVEHKTVKTIDKE